MRQRGSAGTQFVAEARGMCVEGAAAHSDQYTGLRARMAVVHSICTPRIRSPRRRRSSLLRQWGSISPHHPKRTTTEVAADGRCVATAPDPGARRQSAVADRSLATRGFIRSLDRTARRQHRPAPRPHPRSPTRTRPPARSPVRRLRRVRPTLHKMGPNRARRRVLGPAQLQLLCGGHGWDRRVALWRQGRGT